MGVPRRQYDRTDRFALRGRAWLPWFALLSALAIGWWLKAPCLDETGWSEGIQYDRFCYSDIAALWFTRDFSQGAVPYFGEALEYPPLIGLQIWVTSSVARAAGGGVGWFFSLNAAVNAALAGLVLHLLGRLGIAVARRLWWSAAPSLVLYVFFNWDLLALAALMSAVVLVAARHDAAAGAAAGLGVSAKLFPGVLVPLVALDRLSTGRRGRAVRHLVGAVGVWGAINLPLAVLAWEGWSLFFSVSQQRGATNGTLWALASRALDVTIDGQVLNLASALLLALGSALILWVGFRRVAPGWRWTLALPLLAWFLLTNKVYSPQFTLWLIPLLAVVAPRLRLFLALALADLAVFFTEFQYLGAVERDYGPLGAAVAFRAAVLAWIAVVTTIAPRRRFVQFQEPHQSRSSIASGETGTPYQIGRK